MTRPFVSFSPSVSSNKPSGASKHEGLKWYTVWKLSIQLLMSEICDPEAETVFFSKKHKEKETQRENKMERREKRWGRRRRERGNYKISLLRYSISGSCCMQLEKLIYSDRTMSTKCLIGWSPSVLCIHCWLLAWALGVGRLWAMVGQHQAPCHEFHGFPV